MGVNNLSPRDTILLIIIANVVCYFLGYQIIVAPLISAYNNIDEQRQAAEAEYDGLKTEADNEQGYRDRIDELDRERKLEIDNKFYTTVTAEKFHKWFSNLKSRPALSLTNFEIKRNATMTTDDEGNEVADFVDNEVSVRFTTNKEGLVQFLNELEANERASIVKSINFSPVGDHLEVNAVISFYSINKDDGADQSFAKGVLDLGSPTDNPERKMLDINLG